MKLVAELQTQRDAMMIGHYVQQMPFHAGHACLVAHIKNHSNTGRSAFCLSDEAIMLVSIVIGHFYPAQTSTWVGEWNDTECEGLNQAIHVIDEAILLAKEIERDS